MRVLIISILLFASQAYSATVTFNDGFESGTINGFKCSGNCPIANVSSKMTGSYGGDFILTRSMTNPYRTEVTTSSSAGDLNVGGEYWVGLNFNHIDWQSDSSSEIAPIQIHLVPSVWGETCGESAVGIAPFYMITSGTTLKFQTYGSVQRWSGQIQLNTWRSVVIHYIPSRTASGLIEAWIDGNKIATVSGQNVDSADKCGEPYADRTYLKLGIYKWDWKSGRPATGSTRRQIYIDNVKIASGSNGYDLVYTAIGSPPIDSTPPVISNLTDTSTATSCTVNWNTNEASNSRVDYGLTTSYDSSTTTTTTYLTTHSRSFTGLTQNSTYHYKVTSVDAAGNSSSSADQTCVTPQADVTAPTISSVVVSGITTSGATITWTTNEASDSWVNYGTTTSYGTNAPSTPNASMVTSHSVTLSGLSQSTGYNFKVVSKDASNNSAESGNFTFTTATPDTTPPTVSAVTASSITGTEATITWTTNESSDSRVDYGATTAYGSNRTNASLVTSHSISLSGLTPGTTYHYKASSKDASGNNGQGSDLTFTTLDTVAPTLSSVSSGSITETTATITWTTNEPADGLVVFGPTTSYGSNDSSAALTTSHSFSLTGLTPGSVYHYRVTSKDAALNSSNSGDLTFTTASPADVDPPLITSVSSGSIGNTTATITWSTDEPSDSRVDFGTTLSYGGVESNAAFVTSHSVNLTGLAQNTTYHFKVTSKDGANNSAESLDFTFTTVNVDNVPPNISTIVATPSATGAVITWVTNEASNSSVDYGLTTAYGSNSADQSSVTVHSITLTGLSEKTTYNYKIHSTDASGNTGHSANLTFATLDATAPTISNVAVSITGTGATFTWITNEASNSRVDYGATTAYGSNQSDAALVTSHSITVTGLSEGATYHYKITSEDASGNSRNSADAAFTTLDQTGPVISNVVCVPTSNTIRCTWTTDEEATTRIKFVSPITTEAFVLGRRTEHDITVSNLSINTPYTYKITGTDSSDNISRTENYTTATLGPLTPVISNIVETLISYDKFTVTWDTDLLSTSKVQYGLTASYGSEETDLTASTAHEIAITGLSAFTEYHYRICSASEAENCGADRTFVTDPIPTVTISGIGISPAKNSAVITWTTDNSANSAVLWGADASVSSTPITDDTLVTSHSVNITGLLPKKKYYFRVQSIPPGGQEALSPIFTFTTLSGSGLRSDKFGPP